MKVLSVHIAVYCSNVVQPECYQIHTHYIMNATKHIHYIICIKDTQLTLRHGQSTHLMALITSKGAMYTRVKSNLCHQIRTSDTACIVASTVIYGNNHLSAKEIQV